MARTLSNHSRILQKSMGHALSGKGAHVEARSAWEGLDWGAAGIQPEGVPHSIFQLLNHLIYWQDWVVHWLDGANPPLPEKASGSWPGDVSPSNEKAWKEAVARFIGGIDELNRQARETALFSKGDGKSRLEMLQTIASHNSYHLGQVVVLRQMMGTWPPPSGGLTW